MAGSRAGVPSRRLPGTVEVAVRPQLNPALRRVWRDGTSLQLGLDPERAVVVDGLDPASARLVESLDGTRDLAAVMAHGASLGVDAARVRRLLRLLTDSGALVDAAAPVRPLTALDQAARDRLAPDLAALSLVHGGDAVTALGRRRGASVAVHGADRVGAPLALLLAAAGVGYLLPEDGTPARPTDLSPAGLDAAALGGTRGDGVRAALRRVAPGTATTLPREQQRPDVAVLVGAAVTPAASDGLLREGVAHLHAAVRETRAVLGPFVVPGRTACARCQDLHRRDRDPAWPRVAAQLAGGGRAPAGPAPCDAVLAAAVAAHAALHVLTWLDSAGARLPPSADGTLEAALPEGSWRRRTWPPHPGCGCRWSAAG